MPERDIGLTLLVLVDLVPPAEDGPAQPIRTGYRPLCSLSGPDGDGVIGLCELELEDEIPPAGSGEGRLLFDAAVSDEVRALLRVGSRFALMEGDHPIGTATVREME
jgi:hypothetical protein